mgnify:CR=1 FL=1
MAKPNAELIIALRNTARKLRDGAPYMWGHMGACNCGNLAQELSRLSKQEIHERAMKRMGDWNDQCDDFCPTSGLAMDDLIYTMLNAGLSIEDLKNLEKLSDRKILKRLPQDRKNLMHNKREDVIIYLQTWAGLLEKQLLQKIQLPKVGELQLSDDIY